MIGLILSSSAVAAIVSSVCSYIIQRSALTKSYKQDYYKMVIKKRMECYEYIETHLEVMKMTTIDCKTGEGYHSMFGFNKEDCRKMQIELLLVISHSMWLSDAMLKTFTELNKLILTIDSELNDDVENNIRIGKRYYKQLSDIRIEIENNMKVDLQTMYDVDKFLKRRIVEEPVTYEIPKRS